MPLPIGRREFLAAGAAMMAGTPLLADSHAKSASSSREPKFRRAVKFQMVETDGSILERFALLRDVGFDGTEIHTRFNYPRQEVLRAAEETGVTIHGVLNSSNPDIKSAIDLAKYYGATSVLCVAGRVKKEVPYDVNYRQSQEIIRRALPHAEKHGIRLLVENVWNNFLLSPLEMARYIDEFDSPMVGVYFDVGNIVRVGWPEHWIRILGKRIVKLDIKEYSREKQMNEGLRKGFEVEIGDGDCDWPAVLDALEGIGYSGWTTAEVKGGGRQRLQEIAERMGRVLRING